MNNPALPYVSISSEVYYILKGHTDETEDNLYNSLKGTHIHN